MKLVLKIIGGLVLVALLGVGGALGWVSMDWPGSYPDTPTPELEASSDPEVIAHGEYVFHQVAHCTACHAPKKDLHALESGQRAVPKGGYEWNMGPVGTIYSANITQAPETGIGKWSDGDMARVIRHAIKPDDTPAPMMVVAGVMSDEDLRAVISYMRTIEPVENEIPQSEITAVGKLLTRAAMPIMVQPRPASMNPPEYVPAGEVSVERGKYLADGPAMCLYCHSEMDLKTAEIISHPYSGGAAEPDPTDPEMEIVAPNITTGGRLQGWGAEQFIARMRAGRALEGSAMPWENFRDMTDADLESIYMYLKSIEPSDNAPGPSHREAGWKPEEG